MIRDGGKNKSTLISSWQYSIQYVWSVRERMGAVSRDQCHDGAGDEFVVWMWTGCEEVTRRTCQKRKRDNGAALFIRSGLRDGRWEK